MIAIFTIEFYSATKKNEVLSFAGKWIELENTILSDASQVQEAKICMFSLICGIQRIQIQQYNEKQVTLRGGHIQEGKGKRKKLR
jgi:hypothetical protein